MSGSCLVSYKSSKLDDTHLGGHVSQFPHVRHGFVRTSSGHVPNSCSTCALNVSQV